MTRAERIAEYMQGWNKTSAKVFERNNFSIHLIGKHNVLLVGDGKKQEMRFYDAAIYVMEYEMRNGGWKSGLGWPHDNAHPWGKAHLGWPGIEYWGPL